jgi:hypothetical protein|tara:strand:- start:6257 stop:6409 length:153 start_codon:yes stop_codon:yes gene_type:complete
MAIIDPCGEVRLRWVLVYSGVLAQADIKTCGSQMFDRVAYFTEFFGKTLV